MACEQNLYVRTAVLNKMTCAVSLQLQNFRRVYVQVPLFKFQQCEDYCGQSKLFFEPLTFAWQRCLLQLEYFDFVCLYFHCVFALFGYVFIIILIISLIRRSEFFIDNFRDQVKRFRSTVG